MLCSPCLGYLPKMLTTNNMTSETINRYLKRSLLCLAFFLVGTSAMMAQAKKNKGFDPKRFEAELEQFITTEAALSPKEAAAFFPVYRQLMKRQRMLFDEMKRYHHVDTRDNDACAQAIRKQDELDIEMKQLQQEYHGRFILILPAGKVMSVIKAEEKFHRMMFRRMRPKPQN